MNRTDKQIKRELMIGMAGVFLIIFTWRLLTPVIVQNTLPAIVPLINIAAIYSVALVPLVLILRSKEEWAEYGITAQHLPKQILIGILIGLGMGCVLTLPPMALGLEELVYTGSVYQSTEEALFRLVYFIFVIGPVEEFIFRGFVYHKLKEICLSDMTPILLSSLLFGLYHLNILQVLTTGLIGAFFCLCREKIPGCTLLSLAIAHGLHDWLIRLLATYF